MSKHFFKTSKQRVKFFVGEVAKKQMVFGKMNFTHLLKIQFFLANGLPHGLG